MQNEMMSTTQLFYSPCTYSLREFERLGKCAKDAGFTHLYISWLRDRTDYRGDDAESPWCEWSILIPSLFKHARLKAMGNAFPAEWTKRQVEWMQRKHDICAKLDMKAVYFGMEPHWLPNRVYEKHPEWRGCRCDNSLRSAGLFFAPNTDHPEIRELYHAAAAKIVKLCPLIDTFHFHTNDAGGGFIWSQKLYVNPNGPTGYEGADMGVRVTEFLENIRQGAIDGGAADPHVITAVSTFSREEQLSIHKHIKPGLGVQGRLRSKDAKLVRECSLGPAGTWRDGYIGMDPFFRSYPNPFAIVDAADSIKSGAVERFQTGGCSPDYFDALKLAMEMPVAKTQQDRLDTLKHMAAGMYGDDVATDVVEAWYVLNQAFMEESMTQGDLFANVMLRWLTRPLVAHQDLLSTEEKAYWIKHIYQSKKADPETWMSYGNVVGYPQVYGWPDATYVALGIDRTEGTLLRAAEMLEAASKKAPNRKAAKRLLSDSYAVRVHRCALKTVRHFGQMHALILLRDEQRSTLAASGEEMTSTRPEQPDLPHGNMGSHGLFFMHRAMRWELDNMHELIGLLERAPEPVFFTVDAAREGSLVLGPNLVAKLKKKVRIMLKHWRDAEIGYYRPTLGG